MRSSWVQAAAARSDPTETPTLLFDGSPDGDCEFLIKADHEDDFDTRLGPKLHVYEVEMLLGSGGMGRVYLARHGHLDRRCAVKVLSPRAAQRDVDFVLRFQQEGKAAAALNHPNVVVTHAIGEERSFHFLEMEYLSGGSLRQLVRSENQLAPLRATHLAARIADGLAAAHRLGIVHRDLKADNVMLTLSGIPKITDFGLAKRVLGSDVFDGRYMVGTPQYMAPELFAGEPASPASDVYALGVIYYLLLTGRLPFTVPTLNGLIDAVRHTEPPCARSLVPDLPLEMAECLAQLMDKCPRNRPSDGAAASQLLQAVAGQTRDLDTLLRDAFVGRRDVTWTHVGECYTLRVALAAGRRQFVTVEPSPRAAAERLLVISSVCGPADADHYEAALRLNAELPHGSITIRDLEGVPMFCATNTYPRASADAESIRRSVLELAQQADALEVLLTDGDLH